MTDAGGAQTRGVLLCQAGGIGVAFAASAIAHVRPCSGNEGLPFLRQLAGLGPAAGRVVMGPEGDSIAVDTVEVHSETLTVLQAPPMLRGHLGGSLQGFIQAKDKLWPLFGVAELSRLLQSRSGEDA